jgi:hypothetical protein
MSVLILDKVQPDETQTTYNTIQSEFYQPLEPEERPKIIALTTDTDGTK